MEKALHVTALRVKVVSCLHIGTICCAFTANAAAQTPVVAAALVRGGSLSETQALKDHTNPAHLCRLQGVP
jgi:hypothetical protein